MEKPLIIQKKNLYWHLPTGSSGGVVVKLLACGASGRGSSPVLVATISEIGHLLLPSPDMAEISLKRRLQILKKINQQQTMHLPTTRLLKISHFKLPGYRPCFQCSSYSFIFIDFAVGLLCHGTYTIVLKVNAKPSESLASDWLRVTGTKLFWYQQAHAKLLSKDLSITTTFHQYLFSDWRLNRIID